ncbi:hypothetical protein B566_EDAN007166 [Ephemera danica]|nr:hypothetical protein B566_EDAN007166 [Ephemera danica]
MHLSSTEVNLLSQETDLDSHHLSSTEMNLLSQETVSSQEMECVIPEVDDKVNSYPTKRKSDEPLNTLSNKHFKYFEQAMSSYSGDFPNESLSLISEAIHTLNIPTQMKEQCLAPITLEDFIKEMSQRERKTWRVLSLQSSHWKFSVLHGTAILSLKLSSDGNITEAAFLPNSDVLDKLPRTHQTVWQFCLKQLEAKFPSSTIQNHYVEAACVPDLLSKLTPILNSLTSLGRGLVQATSFCVLKFYGNRYRVQFSLWSFKMRLLVKVKLDLSDWENLSTDHITIHLVHGNVKTEDLKGLVNSVPRTWNLVPSFIQNIREYIQTLDDFCFTFPRALRHSSR